MTISRKKLSTGSGIIARILVLLMILSITAGSRKLVCVSTMVGQIPPGSNAAVSYPDHHHGVEFTHFHPDEAEHAGEPICGSGEHPLNHFHSLDAISPVVLPGNLLTLPAWKPFPLANLLQSTVSGFIDPVTFEFAENIARSEATTVPQSAFATTLRPSVILQV